jgi:hypothetical protein
VGPVNLALWAAGVALIAFGFSRARGPWQRYQDLKAQDAYVARYEAWRGGVRDTSPSGASVAMDMFRKQARTWGAVAIVGFVLVLVGFLIR